MTNSQIILVTGPARSGKSQWSENLARNTSKSIIYIATAQPDPQDSEWMMRIQQHQSRRPNDWITLEVGLNLSATIMNQNSNSCLLIDSLGTWLANLLELNQEDWNKIEAELLSSIENCLADLILVAEEVGWGVIPAYPSGRMFRDRLGILIQKIAAIAQVTYLVTGGYALNLTQLGMKLN